MSRITAHVLAVAMERFPEPADSVADTDTQQLVTAQRAELHLDLTDDAIRDLATRPDSDGSAR